MDAPTTAPTSLPPQDLAVSGLGADESKFGSVYRDAKGEARACFNLPKRETLILVSGYSVELRARIIDRWQELESKQPAALPENREEFLAKAVLMSQELLAEASQRALVAEHKVAELTPIAAVAVEHHALGRWTSTIAPYRTGGFLVGGQLRQGDPGVHLAVGLHVDAKSPADVHSDEPGIAVEHDGADGVGHGQSR